MSVSAITTDIAAYSPARQTEHPEGLSAAMLEKIRFLLNPHRTFLPALTNEYFPLESLPDELGIRILSFLSRDEILNCSEVSRKVRNWATDTYPWERLFKENFRPWGPLPTLINFRDAYIHCHLFYCNLAHGVYAARTLPQERTGVMSSLIPIGDKLFSASEDKKIKVWDLQTGAFIKTFAIDQDAVKCLAADGEVLYSGCYNGTITAWNLATGEPMRTFTGHHRVVFWMVIDGKTLYSAGHDGTIRVWDVETGACKKIFKGEDVALFSLVLVGRRLYAASFSGAITVWDVDTGTQVDALTGHRGPVYALTLFDKTLYSASHDGTISAWDLESGECTKTLGGDDYKFTALAQHAGILYSGSMDGSVMAWDVLADVCINTFVGHTDCVFSLVAAGGGIYSASHDKTIRVMNFGAADVTIFQELAELFRNGSSQALSQVMDRFECMPGRAKIKIFEELERILALNALSFFGGGIYAFYDEEGYSSTPLQKAQAIENYLAALY